MMRGQRLALQLVGRGSSSCRRGLGFFVSSEERPCSEAKHLVVRSNGIATSPETAHENSLSSRIPKLLSKNGYSEVLGTFSKSDGRQWLGFHKRDLSSSATKVSDEQKEALVSRSDEDVGGQGQPPPSQPLERNLLPTSEEEEKIAPVLARADLLITRNVEWANLALGFEQQNKYVVMDPHQLQAPVGYIVEESNVFLRQFMRTRRPFEVSVLDANGEEVCRVRRPAFLINSSMFIEINGKVIGECHGRWHLWKRIYDVYIGNKQFATVENPGLWNWTFTLTDENGGVLAEIDRNWRGFGFEFLTDAGKYAVRFGNVLPKGSIHHGTPVSEEGVERKPFLLSKNETMGDAEMQQLQEAADKVDALAVARPLSLTERAVALALAVSLDNDYFSRHSGHSGHGVGMPIPYPFYSEAVTAEESSAGSSNDDNETGHEVFPRQGVQGSQPENTAGEVSSGTKDDDPFHGIFDEPRGGDQNNDAPPSDSDSKWGGFFDDTPVSDDSDSKWGRFFDDTPDTDSGSGSGWGLGDWGTGSDS